MFTSFFGCRVAGSLKFMLPWMACLAMGSGTTWAQNAPTCGLVPLSNQIDGFESGNYENFAPIYAGSASSPASYNFSVNRSGAIAGSSLFWNGTSDNTTSTPQRWMMVSNAFYTGKAYTISVDVVLPTTFFSNSATTEVALIGAFGGSLNGAAQSYSRSGSAFSSNLDALRIQRSSTTKTTTTGIGRKKVTTTTTTYTQSVLLSLNANSSNASSGWKGSTVSKTLSTASSATGGLLQPGTVYTLMMTYDSNGTVTANILNKGTSTKLLASSLTSSATSTTPSTSVGVLIDMPGVTSGSIGFDNFSVSPASTNAYSVPSNQWTRAPFPSYVMLSRTPEMPQGEGYWVGSATGFFDNTDGLYKMWYRLRNPSKRGYGFGYATSTDGLNWKKYTGNPVFTPPTSVSNVTSVEKISVRKVNGVYRAWYSALYNPTGNTSNAWYVRTATSADGISWVDQGPAFGDPSAANAPYYKDPEVVIVNGTYYMYVLYDGNPSASPYEGVAVFTSPTGLPGSWTLGKQFFTSLSSHPGIFYAQDSAKYWLFHDMVSIKEASSTSPTGFTTFTESFVRPHVGLDDGRSQYYSATDTGVTENNGVNYPFFMGDELGQLPTDRNVLMYYQARHSYSNNQSNWAYAQDGKVALAGRFQDLFINVPSTVTSGGTSLTYSSFPANCQAATGFSVNPSGSPASVTVTSWNTAGAGVAGATVGSWNINAPGTTQAIPVSFGFSGLVAGQSYHLINTDTSNIVASGKAIAGSTTSAALSLSTSVGAAPQGLALIVAPSN